MEKINVSSTTARAHDLYTASDKCNEIKVSIYRHVGTDYNATLPLISWLASRLMQHGREITLA